MTYIEFFDRTASENICACLANAPERVILVGEKKNLSRSVTVYRKIFLNRDHDVEFICKSINRNDIQSIVNILSEIVETYDDCVFDLTGGDDLLLVAVGIVSERYRDRHIQMHRFNISSNTVTDCDQDGRTIVESELPAMTVAENIMVYGGVIVRDDDKEGGTFDWTLDREFREDIGKIWDICKVDVRLWNTQIGVIAEAWRIGGADGLTAEASVSRITAGLKRDGGKLVYIKRIMNGLLKGGLITECKYDEETLRITFKNEQVRRCLTKSGQALEMKMYLAILAATDNKGKPVYNDVMNGVRIDWDGEIHTGDGAYDTENEIDIMMMHGIAPVFVSCKNGDVDPEELYKLNSVAARFGGKYAKKILVASGLEDPDDKTSEKKTKAQRDREEAAKYIRQRAKDMGIHVIEGIQKMDDVALAKKAGGFWNLS